MIVNGKSLLAAAPIVGMLDHKVSEHGVSHGLSEAGYDIRLKQEIHFRPYHAMGEISDCIEIDGYIDTYGRFTIASAIEEFQMPDNLVGIVHDKSTWARRGLSVFNTVIEPGWGGFLTLELVYHGQEPLHLPAGCGIAQVVFHETTDDAAYDGKYSNQPDHPVQAILK